MLNEFDIIQQYFSRDFSNHPEIIRGIGDDAAIFREANATIVASVDTLLVGHHFLPDCLPADIAYKALAVNLSDFAAMGATPRWFTLALTILDANPLWLAPFSDSLFSLAKQYDLVLLGGDTTQGPMSITIQLLGTVNQQQALLRSGAKVGDYIYVSNTIGDAGLALQYLQKKIALTDDVVKHVLPKLHRPQAQVALGKALDLNHILIASGVGADIYLEKLPLSASLLDSLSRTDAEKLALTAGDDYQLCFTMAPNAPIIAALSKHHQLTHIGEITTEPGLRMYKDAKLLTQQLPGWQHFS
jgi:thiamine-monophosphate kinase